MITSKEFVAKALGIANNYKTLYVVGCFGAASTETENTILGYMPRIYALS